MKIKKEQLMEVDQNKSLEVKVVLEIKNEFIDRAISKEDIAEGLYFDFLLSTGEDSRTFNQLSEEAQEDVELTEERILEFINNNLENLDLLTF